MTFWVTSWKKTANAAATKEQLALLQHGVVRLETKAGKDDTEETLSHDVLMLQTKVVDEDTAGIVSHDVATLQKKSRRRGNGWQSFS